MHIRCGLVDPEVKGRIDKFDIVQQGVRLRLLTCPVEQVFECVLVKSHGDMAQALTVERLGAVVNIRGFLSDSEQLIIISGIDLC